MKKTKTNEEPTSINEKVSSSFKETIKKYLEQQAAINPAFAEKYSHPQKTIEQCCSYIIQEVQKMQVSGLSDEEVYYLARHYYEEENLKVNALPAGLKVVVNQHIELSEEEKKVAHQKALEEYTQKELKKIEEEAHKKAIKEQKAIEKAKQREELKKEKALAEKNSLQISLFDFIGEN